MEVIHKITPWRMILVYIFTVIAVLTASYCFYLSVIEHDLKWLVACAMPLMICSVFSLFVVKKVIITQERIVRTGLFNNKATMFLSDIAGYRLRRVPKNPNSLMLVLVSFSGEKIPIPWFQLVDGKRLLAWVQKNYKSLDEIKPSYPNSKTKYSG